MPVILSNFNRKIIFFFLDHNISEYKTPAAELESALEFARTNYLNSKNGNIDNHNKIFTDEELSDEEER